MKDLREFLQSVSLKHEVWKEVSKLEDSFVSKVVPTNPPKKYIPIEDFRNEKNLHFSGKVERAFQSSGTTEKNRSISKFSKEGLLLYKAQSLKIFHDVMKRFFGEKQFQIQGISLIPNAQTWPTSSLAQMLTWFSEFWNLKFLDMEEFKRLDFLDFKEPVWIFATPFQLIQLFDEGFSTKLPPKSILFETGGTKGKTRELRREELYSLISERLDIPQEAIISEYGMCELASQAYDFAIPNELRRFRFPSWVQVYALPGLNQFLPQGEGALLVDDPLRIDYASPLRVQDIVRLYEDHSFEILGRVPNAVLKGCSLLTEKPLQSTETPKVISSASKGNFKSENFLKLLDENAVAALSRELGSYKAAESAIRDLRHSIENMSLKEALAQSKARENEDCLFIAPNNHSLALVYPLFMAAHANFKIHLRMPKAFEDKSSFLNIILKAIPNLTILSSEFRLGVNKVPSEITRLFIFCEDKTIEEIKRLSSLPLSSSGSGITVNVLKSLSKANAKNIAKDMLSLGQRGCMSSRALFVCGKWEELPSFLETLSKECVEFWNSDLSIFEKVALDHEEIAFKKLTSDFYIRKNMNDPLFPIFRMDEHKNPSQLLSALPFVLPIFFYGENERSMLEDLEKFPSLFCVSTEEKLMRIPPHVRLCKLGEANTPPWDGLHNGKALFD